MNEKSPVSSPNRLINSLHRPLGLNDLPWLNELRSNTSEQFNKRSLYPLNELIQAGSEVLTRDTHSSTVNSVTAARKEFFEDILGWDDAEHPLHKSYQYIAEANERLVPLNTVVGTQRVLDRYGIVASNVIKAHARIITSKPKSVIEKVETMYALGLNATKLVNANPSVLGYKPESLREKIENLSSLGFDASETANTIPAVLSYNPESLRLKFLLLQRYGVFENNQELYQNATFIRNVLKTTLESLTESLLSIEKGSPDDTLKERVSPKLARNVLRYIEIKKP